MSPLLVVAIAAVAIGLTIRSARRGIGDRQTLEAHHRALDTLAEMSVHRTSAPPAQVPATRRPAHASAGGKKRPRARPPVWPDPVNRGPIAPPSGPEGPVGPVGWSRPAVAGGAAGAAGAAEVGAGGYPAEAPPAPLAPPMPAAALVARSLTGSGAVRRRPPAHLRRRAVPPAFVGAVGAVVVGALGLGVGLALVVGGPPSRSGVKKPAAAAARLPQAPPTTSAAPVVLAAGDNQEARFQVTRTGTSIDLVATATCWIQIRTGDASGAVLYTGVLQQGDRRPVPAGQPVWVRIGNPPGMSIQVNGALLPFSAPASSQPFNLVFQPSA